MSWKNMSIGEMAARYPQSIGLFLKKNIDFCCGGKNSLKEELLKDTELEGLLEDLVSSSPEEAENLLSLNQAQLVDHILVEFHEKHKKDLPQIIELANKVENVHNDHEEAPLGLTKFLVKMSEDLTAHMGKEEIVLFPILKSSPSTPPAMPIKVMMAEHDEHRVAIQQLTKLARNFQPPNGACNSWTTLYKYMENFVDELKEHIHIENNILFPKALGEQKSLA